MSGALSLGRRAWQAMVLAAAMGIAASAMVLWLWDPASSDWFPRCPFRLLTGLHCPGCGTSRALHHLLHGHLALALRHNVLAILTLPGVSWAIAAWMLGRATGRSLWTPGWVRTGWFARALLCAIVCFCAVRNLPWWPFTLLAPP